MLETRTIEINQKKFELHSLSALKALYLDKQIMTLLFPVLSGMEGSSLTQADIKMETSIKAITQALNELKEDEFFKLIMDLFSTTIYHPIGKPPTQLNESNGIEEAFKGDIQTIYKLIWEVMKYNKFTPFELLGGGNGTNIINTLLNQTQKAKPRGTSSGKSGSLLDH